MLLQTMEENCTLRPCATDFSIAAIMARHDRRNRNRQLDAADALSPLGRQHAPPSPRPTLTPITGAVTADYSSNPNKCLGPRESSQFGYRQKANRAYTNFTEMSHYRYSPHVSTTCNSAIIRSNICLE